MTNYPKSMNNMVLFGAANYVLGLAASGHDVRDLADKVRKFGNDRSDVNREAVLGAMGVLTTVGLGAEMLQLVQEQLRELSETDVELGA